MRARVALVERVDICGQMCMCARAHARVSGYQIFLLFHIYYASYCDS